MKLKIYGDSNVGYSGHGEYEKDVDPELDPCPFCGGEKLEVTNTHTPSYWVECECSAQIDGQSMEGDFKNKNIITTIHEEAFKSAIEAWNHRVI